LSKSTLVPSE